MLQSKYISNAYFQNMPHISLNEMKRSKPVYMSDELFNAKIKIMQDLHPEGGFVFCISGVPRKMQKEHETQK